VQVETEPFGKWGDLGGTGTPAEISKMAQKLTSRAPSTIASSPGRYPMRLRSAAPPSEGAIPKTSTRPADGRSRSSSTRIVVDFPAPLGPRLKLVPRLCRSGGIFQGG